MIQLLLHYEIDPNAQDRFGWTGLLSAAPNANVEVVKALLIGGADPSLVEQQDMSALDYVKNFWIFRSGTYSKLITTLYKRPSYMERSILTPS
ncbi:ankyrin repeat domain-containing protein [Bacillaceae bacterium S4-13-58]